MAHKICLFRLRSILTNNLSAYGGGLGLQGSVSTTFLSAAFRSKKRKTTDDFTAFFVLLGSWCIKAAHQILSRSTPFLVI